MKFPLPALAVFLMATAAQLSAQLAEGDRLYARRAEGHQGARARAEQIDGAIAAYERAVSAAPGDLEPRVKLLAALRFKGAYVSTSEASKREVFGRGKELSGKTMQLLDRKLVERGIASPSKASVEQLATTARSIPHAAEVFYWDSVLWGEWALVYGKMAAARQGAADRIRRSATVARLSNPGLEGGGGARVLGRLHDQTPRIPLVTGWVSDREAVKFLRESVATDPRVKITRVFLAEALMDGDAKAKREARTLLEEVIRSPNGSDHLVENLSAQDEARALLRRLPSS